MGARPNIGTVINGKAGVRVADGGSNFLRIANPQHQLSTEVNYRKTHDVVFFCKGTMEQELIYVYHVRCYVICTTYPLRAYDNLGQLTIGTGLLECTATMEPTTKNGDIRIRYEVEHYHLQYGVERGPI